MAKRIGNIHPKRTLFLRVQAGTAKSDGVEYELSYNAGDGTPIVRSSKTGKWFTLNWGQILALAAKAGIDKDA